MRSFFFSFSLMAWLAALPYGGGAFAEETTPETPSSTSTAPAQSGYTSAILETIAQDTQKRMDAEIQGVNELCGLQLKGHVDLRQANYKDAEKYSVTGFCNAATTALASPCDPKSEPIQNAIKEKIKEVHCVYAPDTGIKLENGILTQSFHFGQEDQTDQVKAYLRDQL